MEEIRLDTFRAMLDRGYGLDCWCSGCRRWAACDLAMLCRVSRAMGRATSLLVNQVYADALPSGMAHLAERVAERALGTKPGLRVIDGGKPPFIRQPLDESLVATEGEVVSD